MPIEVNRPMRAAWWAEWFGVKLPLVPAPLPLCFKMKDKQTLFDVWHQLEDGIELSPSRKTTRTRLRTMQSLEACMDLDVKRN
jgi:hypothetical protein